jgi:hypothetical protein
VWGGSVTDPSGPDEGKRGVSYLCARWAFAVSNRVFLPVLSSFVYSCVMQLVPMIMTGFASAPKQKD